MAAALMPDGNAVFLDKVENYTQLTLGTGRYAYSAEFNFTTNTPRPLSYKTNAFCSGGSFLADGRVISVGGNEPLAEIDSSVGNGFRGIRYFQHGNHRDGWDEPGHLLSSARWYSSVQIMHNKTLLVVSGSLNGLDPMNGDNNNPTFEILNEIGVSITHSIGLSILERNQPYYMYPFLHLLKDGNIFIFVSRSAEIYDAQRQATVQSLPDLPGAYRTYPNTGGSVLLPLANNKDWVPEVMICGGGEYDDPESPADPTCGRIQPLSADPVWEIERMLEERIMVEGVLIPDGKVVWLNGARQGAQGFGTAKKPCFDALLYDPDQPRGSRWTIAGTSKIPRMYHSVALLLLDGTIMVAGSNPVEQPLLESDPSELATAYPTEFRVEIFTPPYLSGDRALRRPQDIWISQKNLTANGSHFIVGFTGTESAQSLKIALYHGGFVTHSLHMSQRLLFLDFDKFFPGSKYQVVNVTMPPSSSIAPPGPYVVYVVLDGVPGIGQFVMVN
ncbi:glyoxal oxidase N-terminus-domain-containing protein [Talaromyces proteolyticus]|uniref:Glyoxal oxidase N-terminus-domain-containing protein n=1 Tax=Talaromyces proteolyticus TaxID=1131652 RepID=A0AAD4KF51_9EURO|nr:glyoxal oxidase N-terminus-domain-containing protein [Talaromyces proteolyticus]KAH8690537.1 glyoxal oxidase N-terminus-domain-containing protein [Talaromyces proteolyticus]